MNGDWRAFGLTADAVERAGFFDENFHPIYCEDADYEYRCDLMGLERYFIEAGATHAGSAAYRSDPTYAAANAKTYPENVAYYAAKWGGTLRGGERFTSPFDGGGSPRDWTLSLRRLRLQAW
jgi:GT2 family glycosyltransferase